MNISVQLPLDNDGFLRRECPSCADEFKWLADSDETDTAPVSQLYCPRCGVPADSDAWWTPTQLEYINRCAEPAIEQALQDAMTEAFSGKSGLTFTANRSVSPAAAADPEPLMELDDMLIVEPPCHPNELVKIPHSATDTIFCLVCGARFAA